VKLSRRQKATIPFLLSCGSLQDAAVASGISESTLRLWFRDPDFANLIDGLLDEGITGAVQRVGIGLGKFGPIAVERLGKMLEREKIDDEVLIRAINSTLDRLTKIAALRSGRPENV
jgi:hypothetical protein